MPTHTVQPGICGGYLRFLHIFARNRGSFKPDGNGICPSASRIGKPARREFAIDVAVVGTQSRNPGKIHSAKFTPNPIGNGSAWTDAEPSGHVCVAGARHR